MQLKIMDEILTVSILMFLQELNINGEKLFISTLETAPNVTDLWPAL